MPRPLTFRRSFPWLILALALLLPVAVAVPYAVWFSFVLTPLQKQYLGTYMSASLLSGAAKDLTLRSILLTGPKHKSVLAHDTDVVELSPAPDPDLPMALSPEARTAGWTGLTWGARHLYRAEDLVPFLQMEYFDGKSLAQLLLTPALGTALFLVLAGGGWSWFGWRSKHEDQHGRRTKGPELMSAFRWNRSAKGDGIRLRLKSKLGPLGRSFRIPKRLESSHILLMGDTGSGKSNAIRQILRQVEARGESGIVYDPAGEFVQEFYRPERGDLILNPLDERCPYWDLESELYGQGTADAIAAAMLPEKEYERGFFTDAPRRVLARLLSSRPSTQQLLAWMSDPSEIEKRLEGTPQAAYLDKGAGPQRAGVLASLNMIADSLALLPEKNEKREFFATERWGFFRTRWVFLTSKPSVQERILPLHSVWLDLLILRMMEPCANPAKPVWFVLDELASLNKLPQLHTAVTENRKYGNPVVLGFQGRSQLEKRYGQDAEAMLSQPATKIFFKTSEPRAAKWISETLGEIEVERLKESHSIRQEPRSGLLFGRLQRNKSYTMEIATKPLVMASEIAGLEPLRGYIKQENWVVPVRFQFVPKRAKQPGFIERKMVIPEQRLVPPPVSPQPSGASVLVAKPAASKKLVQPRSAFGQKQGSAAQKPRDWDESQWID